MNPPNIDFAINILEPYCVVRLQLILHKICNTNWFAEILAMFVSYNVLPYVTVSAKTVPIGTTIEIHFMA